MSNYAPELNVPPLIRDIELVDYLRGKVWEQFPAMTQAEAAAEVERFLGVMETQSKKDAEIVRLIMPEVMRVWFLSQVKVELQQEAPSAESIEQTVAAEPQLA